MNYIIAINGAPVGFAQDLASAQVQANTCGGQVFEATPGFGEVIFFGREYSLVE